MENTWVVLRHVVDSLKFLVEKTPSINLITFGLFDSNINTVALLDRLRYLGINLNNRRSESDLDVYIKDRVLYVRLQPLSKACRRQVHIENITENIHRFLSRKRSMTGDLYFDSNQAFEDQRTIREGEQF